LGASKSRNPKGLSSLPYCETEFTKQRSSTGLRTSLLNFVFKGKEKRKDADVSRGNVLLPTMTNIYTTELKENCTSVINLKEL